MNQEVLITPCLPIATEMYYVAFDHLDIHKNEISQSSYLQNDVKFSWNMNIILQLETNIDISCILGKVLNEFFLLKCF